jgi:hypothetical protein
MQDEDFESDDEKAARNVRKHDVTFETARLAFEDAGWIDFKDSDPDEDRYKRICMHQGRVYVVVYTERDDRIRIFSARRANKHEQGLYFER